MEEATVMNIVVSTIFLFIMSVVFLQIVELNLEDTEILTYAVGFCIGITSEWWFPI